jgi:peptidoglycan/LPS O-acetylase OafA/YrhL
MRIAWLDYARAFAAFAVLFYHYLTTSPGTDFGRIEDLAQYGYLGVPLFFMISGFVIASSAEGKSAHAFVSGRALRLYPTFLLCMTVAALVSLLATDPALQVDLKQYVANLTMYPKILGEPFVSGVYWTLVLEIEFYAAMAVLVALGIGRHTAIWHPVWVAGLLAGALLNLHHQFPIIGGYFAFFAAGAIFFDIRRHGLNAMKVLMLLVLAGITLVHTMQESIDFAAEKASTLNPWIAASIVAGFYLAFIVLERADRRGWRPAPAVTLGLMTYPLYLLHAKPAYVAFDFFGPGLQWAVFCVMTVLSVALALLVATVIEPALRPAWRVVIERVVALVLPRRAPGAAPVEAKT